MKILKKLRCVLGHNYTSAVEQGLNPTSKQPNDGVVGFVDYAKMYCKRCGHVYN